MENSNQIRDNVVILAGIAVLLTILRLSAELVVPLLFSLFIVTVAMTPLAWLKRRGLSTGLSIIAVLFVLIIVLGTISMLVGGMAAEFNEALPGYEARLKEMTSHGSEWLSGMGLEIDEEVIDPSAVIGFANSLLEGIGGTLNYAFLIMFTVAFMLSEAAGFECKLTAIDKGGESSLNQIASIAKSVNQYVGAKAMVSLVTGLVVWLALELIGLDFAPLWGLLAFFLNFVPNVGSVLAAIPAVLIAILQLSPIMAGVVVLIYVAVNVTIGNVLEPMVMGQRLGLSPLAVFLSLVFWGWMFGAVGMLLSVPLSMVVKSIAGNSEQTRWLAILLEPAPPGEPVAHQGLSPIEFVNFLLSFSPRFMSAEQFLILHRKSATEEKVKLRHQDGGEGEA